MKTVMDKLNLHAEQFYEYLKIRNYREHTIKSYKSGMLKFLEFIQSEELRSLDEITQEVIYDFQATLYHHEDEKGKAYAIKTQSAALTVVKSFFKYLYDSGRISYNPAATIKMPRQRHPLPYVPTVEEISKLLASVDTTTPMGFRDRTIMEVLYGTGIRAQELCALCLYDVKLSGRELHIREGKGGKGRIVPLTEIAASYMREYLTAARPKLLQDGSVQEVFLSKNGKKLLKTDMTAMIKKYRDLAGIEGKLSPHSLRHACATHLLKNGCDIRYIQQLLGHASLSTTQVYTKVEISDLKAVHERCHPRERMNDEL